MGTSTQTSSTPSAWPVDQSSAVTVLKTNSLQPSGLTIYVDSNNVSWLYLVSNDGNVARRKLDLSDNWDAHKYGEGSQYDFEAITAAKGKLMIGIEGGDSGGSPTYAHIRRFDPENNSEIAIGNFSDSIWILRKPEPEENTGMEAMTFIPDGQYPSSWGTSSYYGGLFLAAFQSEPGRIYVYDLPQGQGLTQNVNPIGSFRSPALNMMISDMYYSTEKNILYVLYDDATDALQELALNSHGTGFVQNYLTTPPYVGCEAVAQTGNNLYIGLDQEGTQMSDNGLTANYVYEYPGFTNHQ